MQSGLTVIRKNLPLSIFALTASLAILAQANPYVSLPNRDSGVFLFFGRMILNGKIPYQYIWDNKPPGIFYVDALGLWLGNGSRWGVWLIELVFLLAAVFLGYHLLRKTWGHLAAIAGTLIWLAGLNQVLAGGNLVEEYSLLFSFLALWFFVRSFEASSKTRLCDAVIGAAAVLSFFFRANNVGTQTAIVAALVLWGLSRHQYRWLIQRLLQIAAGGLVTLLVMGLFCWAGGFLGDMLQATLLYNFFYTGNHLDLQNGIFCGFVNLGFPAWVTLAGYVSLLCFWILNRKNRPLTPLLVLLLVSWPVEIIFSSLSGRGYEHYFINWLPAAALLSGFLLYWASCLDKKGLLTSLERHSALLLLSLAVCTLIFFRAELGTYRHVLAELYKHGRLVEKTDPVADYILQTSAPADRVLAWGGQLGLNFLSQRETLDAYFWYPLYVKTPYTAPMTDQFYQDLVASGPELIVDCRPAAPGDIPPLDRAQRQTLKRELLPNPPSNLQDVYRFIEDHYNLDATIGEYFIYRRKS